jgi:flagellar export protein FliJ
MKKFEFRLASVLRLYENRLDLEKHRLAQMILQEKRVLHNIEQTMEEMRSQQQAVRELIELNSTDLRALSTYNLSAHTRLISLHEELARVRHAMQLQRMAVLREERKVKLVSKLKDKKRAEWDLAVEREIQRDCEDVWLAVNKSK